MTPTRLPAVSGVQGQLNPHVRPVAGLRYSEVFGRPVSEKPQTVGITPRRCQGVRAGPHLEYALASG